MLRALPLLPLIVVVACDHPAPRAGRVTEKNVAEIVPSGTAAAGRVGDYYLRNDLATFIIQRPGHEIALGPNGGTVIDVALAGGNDHFGELIPTIALGRTVKINSVTVVSDGSDGEPALVEARGVDCTNVYYNLEAIAPDLLSYVEGGGGFLAYDPDAPMDLSVLIEYRLPADEARLSIKYTFENTAAKTQGVPFGFLIDSRGSIESFMPGPGFKSGLSKSLDPEELFAMLEAVSTTPLAVNVNDEMAVGILPRRVDDKVPPRVIGDMVPTLGAALLLEASTALGAATEPSFILSPGEKGIVEVDMLIAPRAQDVIERAWALLGEQTVEVAGCVTHDDGTPAPGVRVGLTHTCEGTLMTYRTGADGCFAGAVPPGDYTAIAGELYREPSEEVLFTAPGSVALTLPPMGEVDLDVDVFDTISQTSPGDHPCRLTLLGERQVLLHPALGDGTYDHPGGPIYRMWALRSCNEVVDVAPGRYLAMITRGPELNRIERVIDVAPGAVTEIPGALFRVVDTEGYAASDLHVHSVYSPDSAVDATDRVLTMAAEAMDFWVSTDHDVVSDFTGHIREVGLQDELLTVPGAEVTTFELGHFNAYPLVRDPNHANGGSPDWAGPAGGPRPTMQQLFDEIHGRGALVQANHPRSGGIALGAYFTRAGLLFDPVTKAPTVARSEDRQIPNELLRYPPHVSYFSDDFDVIEVMNGAGTFTSGGMVYSSGVERGGHDWMSFLSYGRRIVAVANSDTHTRGDPPGTARTYIGGHEHRIPGVLTALARGDVVLSTGPFLRATLVDAAGQRASLGDVLSPDDPHVTLTVHVETPDWFDVDLCEVIANVFYADPTQGGYPQPAVPRVHLTPMLVPRPNGGTAQIASVDIPLDLEAPPFDGKDSWIVVRVGGARSNVYPVMISGNPGTIDTTADTPETFLSHRSGVRPWAMTNPIFVDLDGDGMWRGVAP